MFSFHAKEPEISAFALNNQFQTFKMKKNQ